MRFLLLIGFMACRNTDVKVEDSNNTLTDNDNDGYDDSVDCDDDDPTIHPNSSESCDGVDNDCDGEIDNGVQDTFYADVDGDGFGNPDVTMEACEAETGYVANGSDCDDENQESYPGNVETCDNIDNDCNGIIDDDLGETFYVDADGDGFGNAEETRLACFVEEGLSELTGDCDDTDAAINPLSQEECDNIDNDCNGEVDDGVSTTFFLDQDSDGYGDPQQSLEACATPSGYADNDLDCDDANTSVNPGADETCDLLDNDCNGDIDENTAIDALIWYADNDADGFGNDLASQYACFQPNGHVQDNTDCDDGDNDVYPGAPELCSTPDDDDCDGDINEDTAADALIWYLDSDTDGFGDPLTTTSSCTQPAGHVSDSTDCNDGDAAVNPSAQEIIDNATDDDCDALELCFVDNDNDGFRTTNVSLTVDSQDLDCLDPGEASQSLPSTDCNDTDFDVNPNADEACDGVDNNCDTLVDDPSAVDALSWYADSDNDGFGGTTTTIACNQPSGFVSNDTDCVDTDGAINPNAYEICDGIDNNCDTLVDDPSAVDALTWYADSDNDGFGGPTTTTACDQPTGFVSDDTDCVDTDGAINPNADEVCDGIDNDCDTLVDDPSAVDALTWYADSDNDGFGGSVTTLACSQPSGYLQNSTDCDDGDNDVYPGAPELCSTPDDDNCNGSTNENGAVDALIWFADVDNDGFGDPSVQMSACTQPGGHVGNDDDCQDNNGAVNPNANEVCDGVDNDCDTFIDDSSAVDALTWYADSDNDGFGGSNVTLACSQPSGHVSNDDDCQDNNPSVNPAAIEYCDGIDNDCDTNTDDPSAVDATTWYFDNDADGYGVETNTTLACTQPTNHAAQAGDCDDGNPSLINCVSCDAILTSDPGAQTGIYDLDPCNTGTTKEFWCDMDRDGGGWTLAGWQAASAVSNMGVNDAGTVGGSDWSSDLACVGFSEIMVFNDTLNQHFIQSYPQQVWNQTSTNFAIGTNGNAFKHGFYGPGQIMMGCVNYQYGGGNVSAYACDSDGQASAQGHLADYAGEYCSGGRLDYTWAWSDASTCVLRGQPYTWGYAIR